MALTALMLGTIAAPLDPPGAADALQPTPRCVRVANPNFEGTELQCTQECATGYHKTWCVGYQFVHSKDSSLCTLFDDCSHSRQQSVAPVTPVKRLAASRVQLGKVFEPYDPKHERRIQELTGLRVHLRGRPDYTCPAPAEEEPACALCAQHGKARPNCCTKGGAWEGLCDNGNPHTWTQGYQACNGLPVAATPRNGRPVLYTHLHKSGGTTMCELAKNNKEALAPGHLNCNFRQPGASDDHWATATEQDIWPPATAVGCARRQQLVHDYGLTWMSQERWVDPEPCDDLYRVITFRDPLDRMISNFLQARAFGLEHANDDEMNGGGMNVSADEVMACVEPPASCWHKKYYMEWSTAAYDNFAVRTLAGSEAFFLPAGAMTREHLETAKAALRKFNLIMMLDRFDEDRQQMVGLLGWEATSVPASDQNTRERADEAVPFSEEQLRKLFEVNQLDYELLCYAMELRNAHLAAATTKIPEVLPLNNASAVVADCRADDMCRCKIFGTCRKGLTPEPTARWPRHRPGHYCHRYGLCGDDLPEHLRAPSS